MGQWAVQDHVDPSAASLRPAARGARGMGRSHVPSLWEAKRNDRRRERGNAFSVQNLAYSPSLLPFYSGYVLLAHVLHGLARRPCIAFLSRLDTTSFYGIRTIPIEKYPTWPKLFSAGSSRIFHYNTLARCGTMG